MKNRWNEAYGGGKTKGLLMKHWGITRETSRLILQMKSVLCSSFPLLDNLNSSICVHLIFYSDSCRRNRKVIWVRHHTTLQVQWKTAIRPFCNYRRFFLDQIKFHLFFFLPSCYKAKTTFENSQLLSSLYFRRMASRKHSIWQPVCAFLSKGVENMEPILYKIKR